MADVVRERQNPHFVRRRYLFHCLANTALSTVESPSCHIREQPRPSELSLRCPSNAQRHHVRDGRTYLILQPLCPALGRFDTPPPRILQLEPSPGMNSRDGPAACPAAAKSRCRPPPRASEVSVLHPILFLVSHENSVANKQSCELHCTARSSNSFVLRRGHIS